VADTHKHAWCYPHQIIEGRRTRSSEIAVWRYCSGCKVKQIAFASQWQKPSRSYVLEERRPWLRS
jgi:hypothetical protein